MDLKNNKKIQDYLSQVCAQVKFRDVHQCLKLELETHIQEMVEEYLTQGFSEKEAVDKALAQMGDAEIIGKQLNKVHKPKPDWVVLAISFLFINIGLIASYFIQKQGLLTYQIFEKTVFFSILAFITIIGLYLFDYRKLEKYSIHIYLGTLLVLIFTVFGGIQINGSRSWLPIGPFNVNFVQISPIFFILALAGIFNSWNWNRPLKLIQGMALLTVPLLVILSAPSISAGVIFSIAFIVLMIVSGAKLKEIFLISGPLMAILILPIFTQPHRVSRIVGFLDPKADPQGSGYLNIMLSKIISNSGLFGQGLTFERQVIPDPHTDFIFTFLTYTFGWIASILLISFVGMFLLRIASIARQVKNNYAKLLISGFTSVLTVQFLWNILMNLGLAPISGVGLPFISYGGSQLIINGIIVGIISGIYRRKNISQNFKPIKE
ncbi:MAG: FtsW/RodA/SpoVE family cell cycle protein [Clostridia bacterium]|nr:FtsW/RodA/SpoVE family cell cycle protein [Clostridia bacterium]